MAKLTYNNKEGTYTNEYGSTYRVQNGKVQYKKGQNFIDVPQHVLYQKMFQDILSYDAKIKSGMHDVGGWDSGKHYWVSDKTYQKWAQNPDATLSVEDGHYVLRYPKKQEAPSEESTTDESSSNETSQNPPEGETMDGREVGSQDSKKSWYENFKAANGTYNGIQYQEALRRQQLMQNYNSSTGTNTYQLRGRNNGVDGLWGTASETAWQNYLKTHDDKGNYLSFSNQDLLNRDDSIGLSVDD